MNWATVAGCMAQFGRSVLSWKTSAHAAALWQYRQGKGVNGNRNQQNSLSTMEHGKVEIGAEILLRISREFGKSIEWLLTG